MARTALRSSLRRGPTLCQSLPKTVTPAMPVTTTRFMLLLSIRSPSPGQPSHVPPSYQASVDRDDLAGDVTCDVRHQMGDQPRHFVGLPHPLEGDHLQRFRLPPRH